MMVASAALCDRCSDPIAATEEAIATAGRRLFHRRCFACSKRQCGRLLSLGHYGVYQNQIFCPDCFVTLLRLAGNGHSNDGNGSTAISHSGPEGEDYAHLLGEQNESATRRTRSYEFQLRTLQLDESEAEEVAAGEEMMMTTAVAEPLVLVRVDNGGALRRRTPFGASPIPEADELDSQPSPNPAVMPSTWRIIACPEAGKGITSPTILPLMRPSSCKRCSGRVYEAEKVVAASEVWHKGCFRCLRCGRSLEPGKFSDRAGEVYCNSCYAREFGPKGVGCGLGAGILQMHQ